MRLPGGLGCPAARRPDRKDNRLLPGIPPRAQPGGELYRRESLAPAVEQYQPGSRASPLPGDKPKQRLFAPKSLGFDRGVGRDAIQIEGCRRTEQVAPGPLGNEGEGDLQTEYPLTSAARPYLLPGTNLAGPVQDRLDHCVAAHARVDHHVIEAPVGPVPIVVAADVFRAPIVRSLEFRPGPAGVFREMLLEPANFPRQGCIDKDIKNPWNARQCTGGAAADNDTFTVQRTLLQVVSDKLDHPLAVKNLVFGRRRKPVYAAMPK